MAEVEKSWSDEQLQSEDVSKKDIIKFLHENASFEVWKTYLMGFTGCIFGMFDRIYTTWCILSTNNGQFCSSNKDLLLPFCRLHARFDRPLSLLDYADNTLTHLF